LLDCENNQAPAKRIDIVLLEPYGGSRNWYRSGSIKIFVGDMKEADTVELRKAIESQHGGTATLAQSVPVRETFEDQPVWEGIVHVFDLEGHPIATRAYAWSSPIEGSDKSRSKKTEPFYPIAPVDKCDS
jgi:hypothetical protein